MSNTYLSIILSILLRDYVYFYYSLSLLLLIKQLFLCYHSSRKLILRDTFISQINKLRYWMNEGMQICKDSNDRIIKCQNKLHRTLLELRDRQRELRNLLIDEDDYHSHKWNRYNKSLFLPSTKEMTREYNIYPLHKVLALVEKDEKMEELMKNLFELQRLAHEYINNFYMLSIYTVCT